MEFIYLFFDYVIWHYTRGLLDLLEVSFNFLWFTWNYFSIKQLVKTFLTPWHRLGEISSNRWNLFDVFSSVVITNTMRAVGMLVRGITIIFGILALIIVLALELIFLVIWIAMPIIIAFVLYLSVSLLLK